MQAQGENGICRVKEGTKVDPQQDQSLVYISKDLRLSASSNQLTNLLPKRCMEIVTIMRFGLIVPHRQNCFTFSGFFRGKEAGDVIIMAYLLAHTRV